MKLSNKKKIKALEAALRKHLICAKERGSVGMYSIYSYAKELFIEEKIDCFQSMFIEELIEEHAKNNNVWHPTDHKSRTLWLKDQIKKIK